MYCDNRWTLHDALHKLRELLFEILAWLNDICQSALDWLSQSPSLDVAKKDDDLWSPRHAHVAGAHGPATLASEAAFLSHFLPAPGNHPPNSIYHPSTTTLRADLYRQRLAGGGLPHLLPPRPAHREFEARGLLYSHSGLGGDGTDGRQGRRTMPQAYQAYQNAPSQPFPASAAVRAACSQFQAPAEQPPAPSYTAIPAPAHAISRLVEPDIEAQCCALERSGPEYSSTHELYGMDAGSTIPKIRDHPTMLPTLSEGHLGGVTSASQLWQLDAQHSRSAELEQGGELLRDPAVSSQAVPATAQLPRGDIQEMGSKEASRQSLDTATAAEGGQTAGEALQTMQAEPEPLRQQVTVWGNPLATVRMPQGELLTWAPQQASSSAAAPSRTQLSAAQHALPLRAPPGMRLIEPAELTLGALIGEGGFGKVYYGQWKGLEVAVKVMSAEASQRTHIAQEFQREVVAMTLLPDHPNVLRLLGACMQPPLMALVTPFCPKGSLYAMLHSPSLQLSWAQVAFMSLGAAAGMCHLHAHAVLHRDLKSGNLLVDETLRVRVADFGLARVMHDLSTLTGGLGTFQWMAPEVLAHQRYSEKADVYSFGVVLWECTARQVPYAGLNGIQAALAVMERGLRPDIPGHTPARLAALIRDCWQPVPDQRPGFGEVAARLRDMLDASCDAS